MKNSVSISNRYISQIASALNSDMICFMNPYTCEIENVPHDFLCGMYHDDAWQEAVNRVDQWERYVTIEPRPEESVEIMRSFVETCIPSGNLKEKLCGTLAQRLPGKKFFRIVDDSGYRDKWAVYCRRRMMRNIRRKLRKQISVEASLPTVPLYGAEI